MASANHPGLRSLLSIALGLSFSTLAGCAADDALDSEREESAELGELHQPVIGGTTATDCQWPSTVRVQSAAQCTGTLIHARIVTTAAHCIANATATIGFGSKGASGSFSVTARCAAGARGERGVNTANDWAYCVLPEDARIAKLPVTPPLVGCEAALVTPGSNAWVVGFGITSPQGGGNGAKRQVEVKINAFDKRAPGTIDVGDRDKGACHGDSGGPLYVRVSRNGVDYGWRVAGATSGPGATACDCTCSTTYVDIENHVKAIERDEGIDVTPCTDAAGNWQPSAACGGFESAPQSGTGTYPQCSIARTTIPIESCGSGAPSNADAGADAGVSADAGVNEDAGAASDGGASSDAGASNDAGSSDAGASSDAGVGSNADTSSDAGASSDASFGLDAASTGSDLTPEAGPITADAGSSALSDAGAYIPSPEAGSTGVVIDPGIVGRPGRGGRDSGCSAAGGSGGSLGGFGVTLLALALGRVRPRQRVRRQ